jgi:hypothetical protein
MDEQVFSSYLKKLGKKAHVIDNLVDQVRRFEVYLSQERRKDLSGADLQDLQVYAAAVDAANPGRAGIHVRGLAMYLNFTGHPELASYLYSIREAGTAKTRQAFRLQDFQGVNQDHITRLKEAGIANVEEMLEAGKTPEARQHLADQSGVPPDFILELVKLSDLSRLEGVKGIRARLYYDAGVDTLEKLARWEAEELRLMLVDFVRRTGFKGIAPLPKELRSTIAHATKLPKIVKYE